MPPAAAVEEGPAPFHADLSEGPGDAMAAWVVASDGVRLRAVAWGARARPRRGTVLLFTGRTEYAEKYGRVAADLLALGYATATVDWRGQGLSDRLRADRALGHVGRFGDYQRDVAALVAQARTWRLPEPWFVLSHSMGGAIALRALYRGLPVRAAAFVAPMWGLQMTGALRPVAWSVSSMSRAFALSHLLTPGQGAVPYVLRAGFEENALTGDPKTWAWLQAQMRGAPELGLGGPSLHWLNEALREMLRLSLGPAPRLPALAILGAEEAVVDAHRVRRRLSGWPGARLLVLEGARHEVLMEGPAARDRALAEIADLFAAAA